MRPATVTIWSFLGILAVPLAGCSTPWAEATRRTEPAALYTVALAAGDAAPRTLSPASGELALRPAGTPPEGDAAFAAPTPGAGDALLYQVQLRLLEAGHANAEVSAPRLTMYAGQRANISVVNQVAYVANFDFDLDGRNAIANPVISIMHGGLVVDVLPQAVPGHPRAVDLAYRMQVATVERPMRTREVPIGWGDAHPVVLQLPRSEITSVTGVRRVGIGDRLSLGRMPRPGGAADMDIELCVVPVVDFEGMELSGGGVPAGDVRQFVGENLAQSGEPDDAAPEVDLRELLAGPARASGRLVLEPVVVDVALPLDAALDEARATALLTGTVRGLGRIDVVTAPVRGVVVEAQMSEAFVTDYRDADRSSNCWMLPVVSTVRSGLHAELGADALLHLRWESLPGVAEFETTVANGPPIVIELPDTQRRDVSVPLRAGRQLVPVARTADGGTAAVWVTFEEGDTPTNTPETLPRGNAR